MAKDSDKLDIYIKIFNYIETCNTREFYPKTTDILDFVNDATDLNVSERTINRYIHDLSHIFDIDIRKKSTRLGYFIDKSTNPDLKDVYKTIQLFEKAKFFKKIVEDSSRVLKFFDFDANVFQGLHWIDVILTAITNKSTIKILHNRFDKEEQSVREVEPYLIKEYANRWYLIGFDLSKQEFRTFGLDRIVDIEVLKKKFKKHKTDEIKEQFMHTIGLVYSEPKKVILLFKPKQGRYFKANPWHNSYKILQDNKDGLLVEMFVSVNYELEQKILMNHSCVKVIEPNKLREQIIYLQKESINQYK